MKAFIKSSKAISPQDSFKGTFPFNEVHSYNEFLTVIEPNYKDYINPMKLRRMNRLIRMGLTTALECLKETGIEKPGGVISSTGWGCLADTFSFLDELKEKKEEGPSPATFIQSTHNTICGQIAMAIDCQEYNTVIVNHKSSFEHALIEAMLLISEGKDHILVGGIDELASKDFDLKRLAGCWKDRDSNNLSLFNSDNDGTLAGEGAAYFILDKNLSPGCSSQIEDVYFYSGKNPLPEFYRSPDINFIISGFNGDKRIIDRYPELEAKSTKNIPFCFYKHLCGEYDTASSFALWLADQIIKYQLIPHFLFPSPKKNIAENINKILIHHYIEPDLHAFIMVSKAGL